MDPFFVSKNDDAQAAAGAMAWPQQQPAVAAAGTTRRVVANVWQIFGKLLLVFGCIGADFCKKIRVLQQFSKSTKLSS